MGKKTAPPAPSTTSGATTPVATTTVACPNTGPFPFKTSVMTPEAIAVINQYNSAPPTQGATAKTITPTLATLKEAEFLAAMDAKVCPDPPPPSPRACCAKSTKPLAGYPGPQDMVKYEFEDGTVVRYKPNGDAFSSPRGQPVNATYSVEVKVDPTKPDEGPGDVAFKVDKDGNAIPKGPNEVQIAPENPGATPPVPSTAAQKDIAMQAGHRRFPR